MIEESDRKDNHILREATVVDIPHLAVHHRKMFEEIWEKKNEKIECLCFDKIERAYSEKLNHQMRDGSCKAWVIEDGQRIIASGAISIVYFVPTPQDLSSNVAYLHSMYTVKDQRNKHCAKRIVHQAIYFCKSQGIKRLLLNASDEGRPIYDKIGFKSAPDIMRLLLDDV